MFEKRKIWLFFLKLKETHRIDIFARNRRDKMRRISLDELVMEPDKVVVATGDQVAGLGVLGQARGDVDGVADDARGVGLDGRGLDAHREGAVDDHGDGGPSGGGGPQLDQVLAQRGVAAGNLGRGEGGRGQVLRKRDVAQVQVGRHQRLQHRRVGNGSGDAFARNNIIVITHDWMFFFKRRKITRKEKTNRRKNKVLFNQHNKKKEKRLKKTEEKKMKNERGGHAWCIRFE